MTHHAAAERRELTQTLRGIPQQAPTLCDPWTAEGLAAHLILRGSSPRYMVQLLRGEDEAVAIRHRDLAARLGYQGLIDRLDRAPRFAPTRLGALDDAVNLIEYLTHHEDLRRVGDDWAPRLLPADRQHAMWSRLRGMTRTVGRKAIAGVRLQPSSEWAAAISGAEPEVTAHGDVVELMLVALGRARVARVELEGSDAALARFRDANRMS